MWYAGAVFLFWGGGLSRCAIGVKLSPCRRILPLAGIERENSSRTLGRLGFALPFARYDLIFALRSTGCGFVAARRVRAGQEYAEEDQ